MASTSPDLPDLPEWAKAVAVWAARLVIRPSDHLFQAEQRRVPGYQSARRKVIAHVKRLDRIVPELSSIDREHIGRASVPLLTLVAEWERRSHVPPSPPKKGRPRTSADRDMTFHGVIAELVERGWTKSVAMDALAGFMVQTFPPTDGSGARRNFHLYGTISLGYSAKRDYRKKAGQQQADWVEMPIEKRACQAFIARLRAARSSRRNK